MNLKNINWEPIIQNITHTWLAVFDHHAQAGLFTEELALKVKEVYKENNDARNPPTHLFMSPEAFEDLREVKIEAHSAVKDIEERVRKIESKLGIEIEKPKLYGMELCALSELGEGQSLQFLYEEVGGTYEDNDVELVLGIEFDPNGKFVGGIVGTF